MLSADDKHDFYRIDLLAVFLYNDFWCLTVTSAVYYGGKTRVFPLYACDV